MRGVYIVTWEVGWPLIGQNIKMTNFVRDDICFHCQKLCEMTQEDVFGKELRSKRAVFPWMLRRSVEAHGGVLFCPACCGALQKRTAACCCALADAALCRNARAAACCCALAIPVLCRGTCRRALKRFPAVGA